MIVNNLKQDTSIGFEEIKNKVITSLKRSIEKHKQISGNDELVKTLEQAIENINKIKNAIIHGEIPKGNLYRTSVFDKETRLDWDISL